MLAVHQPDGHAQHIEAHLAILLRAVYETVNRVSKFCDVLQLPGCLNTPLRVQDVYFDLVFEHFDDFLNFMDILPTIRNLCGKLLEQLKLLFEAHFHPNDILFLAVNLHFVLHVEVLQVDLVVEN
jgi:hypothetical protein